MTNEQSLALTDHVIIWKLTQNVLNSELGDTLITVHIIVGGIQLWKSFPYATQKVQCPDCRSSTVFELGKDIKIRTGALTFKGLQF
jgi:hypothetical protein